MLLNGFDSINLLKLKLEYTEKNKTPNLYHICGISNLRNSKLWIYILKKNITNPVVPIVFKSSFILFIFKLICFSVLNISLNNKERIMSELVVNIFFNLVFMKLKPFFVLNEWNIFNVSFIMYSNPFLELDFLERWRNYHVQYLHS